MDPEGKGTAPVTMVRVADVQLLDFVKIPCFRTLMV